MDVPSDLLVKGMEQLVGGSKPSAEVQTFKLGDWKLQSGETIPDAFIAYKTFGDKSSPAIVYPSWYSGGTPSPS
jgi:homoserine acetyltransferase